MNHRTNVDETIEDETTKREVVENEERVIVVFLLERNY